MLKQLIKAVSGEKGATYSEYAILAAVIALVVITAAALFGEALLALYESFSL